MKIDDLEPYRCFVSLQRGRGHVLRHDGTSGVGWRIEYKDDHGYRRETPYLNSPSEALRAMAKATGHTKLLEMLTEPAICSACQYANDLSEEQIEKISASANACWEACGMCNRKVPFSRL